MMKSNTASYDLPFVRQGESDPEAAGVTEAEARPERRGVQEEGQGGRILDRHGHPPGGNPSGASRTMTPPAARPRCFSLSALYIEQHSPQINSAYKFGKSNRFGPEKPFSGVKAAPALYLAASCIPHPFCSES